MLIETINKQIIVAMKAHESTRLETMRMLSAALKYAQIDKMRVLTSDEELDVVRKEAKKRNDAIEMYMKANETERANQEKSELEILKEFMPAALSLSELESLIDQAIGEEGKDFGKVMKSVMQKTKGSADGKQMSELVRAKIV